MDYTPCQELSFFLKSFFELVLFSWNNELPSYALKRSMFARIYELNIDLFFNKILDKN